MELAAVRPGNWRDRYGRSADAIKRPCDIACKNNNVVRVPSTAESDLGSAQNAHRSTSNINGLELAFCEEPDTAAIGGPKRQPCALCAIQLLRPCGREVANPKALLPVEIGGNERQPRAVW